MGKRVLPLLLAGVVAVGVTLAAVGRAGVDDRPMPKGHPKIAMAPGPPPVLAAMERLAHFYMETDRTEEAERVLQAMVHVALRLESAHIAAQAGRWEEAVELLQTALADDREQREREEHARRPEARLDALAHAMDDLEKEAVEIKKRLGRDDVPKAQRRELDEELERVMDRLNDLRNERRELAAHVERQERERRHDAERREARERGRRPEGRHDERARARHELEERAADLKRRLARDDVPEGERRELGELLEQVMKRLNELRHERGRRAEHRERRRPDREHQERERRERD